MKARADNLANRKSPPKGIRYSPHAVGRILVRVLKHGIPLGKVHSDIRQATTHNCNKSIQERSGRIMVMGRLGRYIFNEDMSVVITFRHKSDMRKDWSGKTFSKTIRMIKRLSVADIGRWVTYSNGVKVERGRIKDFNNEESLAFVVYNCGDDWDKFMNYTASSTKYTNLTLQK